MNNFFNAQITVKMLLLSLWVALGLVGCVARQPAGPTALEIEIEEFRLKRLADEHERTNLLHRVFLGPYKFEGDWVVGWVTNRKADPIGGVRIEFGLYDGGGSLLGTTLDMVGRLDSGEVWKYRCPVVREGVLRLKLKDLDYHQ